MKSWPATHAARAPGTGESAFVKKTGFVSQLQRCPTPLWIARCPLYGFVTKYAPSLVKGQLDDLQVAEEVCNFNYTVCFVLNSCQTEGAVASSEWGKSVASAWCCANGWRTTAQCCLAEHVILEIWNLTLPWIKLLTRGSYSMMYNDYKKFNHGNRIHTHTHICIYI